jgi:hypothetical protein
MRSPPLKISVPATVCCGVWFLWRRGPLSLAGSGREKGWLLIRAAHGGLYKAEKTVREMGDGERDMIRANH